jgi:hypothetical protein
VALMQLASATAAAELDKQISDIFGLLAVLLVFVIGYFSALLPQAEDLIARVRPNEEAQRRALRTRLSTFRRLAYGLEGLNVLVLALLFSVSRQVLSGWPTNVPFPWISSDTFPTVRGGLILVDVLLVAVLVATAWLIRTISQRMGQLR